MHVRLGDLLVNAGQLTAAQRDEILEEQAVTKRPFGVLAEEMFGVEPGAVEHAWAEQYVGDARRVDPTIELPELEALNTIGRRQAWQFAVLPMRHEDGVLVCCTTPEHLPRALRFTGWKLGHDVSFVVTGRESLGAALALHYPMGAGAEDLLPAEAMPGPSC